MRRDVHINTSHAKLTPLSRYIKEIHRASMLDSEWDPWSEELELEIVSVDLIFGLYSVITTVTLLTVTSLVCAELLSTFFSRGGWRRFFMDLLSFFSRF